MSNGNVIVRFGEVSFKYNTSKQSILSEVDFSVRRGSKMTLMGQNGAGKSTVFQLMNGKLESTDGAIYIEIGLTIATSRQVIPQEQLSITVREFFEACFKEKVYDIDPKIDEILLVVNFKADHDRIIRSFSGGQQARLLLASALIQNPDLLLLDEPTNNLDVNTLRALEEGLDNFAGCAVIISHDRWFLDRVCTHILAFEGNSNVVYFEGGYSDYEENRRKRLGDISPKRIKYRKLKRD